MGEEVKIWVSMEIREALKALGREDESYDTVIRRLIDARLVELHEEEEEVN